MKYLFVLLLIGQVNAQTVLVSDMKPMFIDTINSLSVRTTGEIESPDDFPPFHVWNECVEDAKGDLGIGGAEIYCSKKFTGEL